MESHQFIRDEIKFFMEKSFQFSYVYIGAAFAVAAGSKMNVLQGLAGTVGVNKEGIQILALLLLNLVYLTLASACLFAVLKRGYFILTWQDQLTGHMIFEWELFVRRPARRPCLLDWNVDNYFMVLLVGLVWLCSFILTRQAFRCGQAQTIRYARRLLLLHVIPAWNTLNAIRLDCMCRQEVARKAASGEPGD